MLLVKLKYFTLRLYTYLYVCIIIYLANDKNNNLFDVGGLESEKQTKKFDFVKSLNLLTITQYCTNQQNLQTFLISIN